MSPESDETAEPPLCPNCGSRDTTERESDEYVLEDGTKRRMTCCTACIRENEDGTIRYAVISEQFVRTEIDRTMNDGD